MANTTNLNLIKLDGTEKLKTYPTSFNGNMDTIDGAVGNEISTTRTVTQAISKAEESIAIVANGNTHVAIASGQYVYVKNHGSLAEGLYTATTAISANATLSGSNLSAVSSGGLNNVYSTLNNKLTNYIQIKTLTKTTPSDGSYFLIDPSTDGIPVGKALFIQSVYGGSVDVDLVFTLQPRGSDYVVYVRQNGQEYRGKTVVVNVMYKE